VSGGADSTALLLTLAALRGEGFDPVAGHVNHHLRGAESDADEAWLRALCERLEVPLRVADGTLDADEIRSRGIEAAARETRTVRLLGIAQEVGSRWIATAHQKNDQAETVLMRLLTGSGIGGLRGIHPVRADGFARPLLRVTREEIDQFLAEQRVAPRSDSMNADRRFLRVRLREMLRDLGSGAVENLAAAAEQAAQQWEVVERLLDSSASVAVTEGRTEFLRLPDDRWLRQALLHRHIRRLDPRSRDVSSADLERLAGSLDDLTRVSVTRSLELVRQQGTLQLRRRENESVPPYEFEIAPGEPMPLAAAGCTLSVRRAAAGSPLAAADGSRQLFQLPPGETPRFSTRNRRDGDRFRPLGLSGSKKLKDFFIDRKVEPRERDRVPLLLHRGRIVWIAGLALADEFKVTQHGGDVYEASIEYNRLRRGADRSD
jgi:tRNA(Ile)-lysidine synthase